jgi:hypothetical protein
MAKRLEDTVTLGAAWWRELGSFVIREIRQLTSSGEGVGGRFKEYSRAYRENKTTGEPRIPRQADYSAKPNLRLTGDMMNDLQQIAYSNHGVTIGWPAFGWKVEENAAMGRAISTPKDPLAAPVAEKVKIRFHDGVEKALKGARFEKTVRIGK